MNFSDGQLAGQFPTRGDGRFWDLFPDSTVGGGEASWRFMENQPETEPLEAAQGTGWYSERLEQFGNADAPKLPFDQLTRRHDRAACGLGDQPQLGCHPIRVVTHGLVLASRPVRFRPQFRYRFRFWLDAF